MQLSYDDLMRSIRACFSKEKRINLNPENLDAKSLSSDGIVVIESFISEDVAEKMYKQISQLIESLEFDEAGEVNIKQTKFINRGIKFDNDFNMIDIFDINKLIPELNQCIDIEFISSVIEQSNGTKFELQNFNVYYNNEVKPRVLHVDNFTHPQYKAFIYLTDVDSFEDGPYCYVKGSHLCHEKKVKSYINNFLRGNYFSDMREYDYNDTQKNLGKKGTLIISDQNGVHGAYPQAEGRSRMLVMLNFSNMRIVPR
jgi:hypothetical protein